MYIRNHPIAGCADPVYLVRCESQVDVTRLLHLADKVDISLPGDGISRCDRKCPTPPPIPDPASRLDLGETVDKFIFRVLTGDCTPEETAILPVVLDQLWAARPGAGERDKEGS